MYPVIRSILGILAGIIAVPVVVMFIERFNTQLFPAPDDMDWNNKDMVVEWIGTLPSEAFLLVLFGWQAGAIVGGTLAAWIAGRKQMLHASAIGCFVLLASWANTRIIPGHPDWMVAAGLILPVPLAVLAGKFMTPRSQTGQPRPPSNAGKK